MTITFTVRVCLPSAYFSSNEFFSFRVFLFSDYFSSSAYLPSFTVKCHFPKFSICVSEFFLIQSISLLKILHVHHISPSIVLSTDFFHFRVFFHHIYLHFLLSSPSSIFPLHSFYPLTLFYLGDYFPCKVFRFQRSHSLSEKSFAPIVSPTSYLFSLSCRFPLTNSYQIQNISPVKSSILQNIFLLKIIFTYRVLPLQSISLISIFQFRVFVPVKVFSSEYLSQIYSYFLQIFSIILFFPSEYIPFSVFSLRVFPSGFLPIMIFIFFSLYSFQRIFFFRVFFFSHSFPSECFGPSFIHLGFLQMIFLGKKTLQRLFSLFKFGNVSAPNISRLDFPHHSYPKNK